MSVSPPVFRFGEISIVLILRIGFPLLFAPLLLGSCDREPYEFKPESMHWLQFRGPNASGIAPENANPPVHFATQKNLLWKTEILPGWSSPCIVNDRIFLTAFDKSDSLLYTIAIHREKGEILWKESVKPHGYYDMHPINTYANATVASEGTKIFASFPNYGLIAYDLDGNFLWDFTHEILSNYYSGGSSPLIADSVVVILVNLKQDPRIVGLDCQTGEPAWTIRATEHRWAEWESSSTPVRWNDLLILRLADVIAAYSLVDLNAKWWIYNRTSGSGTPAISDDILFLNSWIEGGERAATFKEDHGMMALPLKASGERPPTDFLWKVNKDTPDTPSPLIVRDRILFIKNGGIISVINLKSGEIIRKKRIGAGGSYFASPMLAGNQVYTCSYNGTVTVLSAEDFSVLSHSRLGERIGASPVAVDDVLYIRTDKHLYAFQDPG